MADKKISELTVATTPTGSELMEIVQGGVNKQTTLQAVADLAGDEHFKGVYVDETALTTAHATAEPGDYAYIDAGVASPTEMWIWDDDDEEWVQTGSPAIPTAAQVSFTPAGSLSSTDVQAALEELDTEKAPLASPAFTGTPAAPTAATSTNTTQVATTAFVQQEITANSLSYTPADELTEIAGLSLETDITALQLMQALEIPGNVAIHADANEGITLTNQPNTEAAFPLGNTYSYTNINTVNIRRMRLIVRVHTASASVNNPRMYIQYSLTAGVSYVTLGLGTVASGDAASLAATGVHMSNWISLPAEARDEDLRWRVVAHGGDGAVDPIIGNVYIEWTT